MTFEEYIEYRNKQIEEIAKACAIPISFIVKRVNMEDKQLLMADLCGRLSYGVMCSIFRTDDIGVGWRDEKLTGYFLCEFYFGEDGISVDNVERIKPYLRPISSMTEEEDKKRIELGIWIKGYKVTAIEKNVDEALDWLNRKMFDYRGLIPKGLALEAPKDMYKVEE